MPGPLSKAIAKKVSGALGAKAKGEGLMPRRKMSDKYGYKTASYHTRKKANVERVHLGLKEKPGRY